MIVVKTRVCDVVRHFVTDPILSTCNYADFGLAVIVVNRAQKIPTRYNPRQLLTAPALLVNRKAQVEVSIHAVAIQEISFEVHLPKDPPWEKMMPIDHVRSALGAHIDSVKPVKIPIAPEEEGTIKLVVKGDPSDELFRRDVWEHERVHLRETIESANAILKPWDDNLERCRREGRIFTGRTAEEATANLYGYIGGTPEAIGQMFADVLREHGERFHGKAKGGPPTVVKIVRRKPGFFNSTDTLEVTFRSPMRA